MAGYDSTIITADSSENTEVQSALRRLTFGEDNLHPLQAFCHHQSIAERHSLALPPNVPET
jgi:hypothetical protein